MALERYQGIALSHPTADRAVIDTASLAFPLAEAQLSELNTGDYIKADETRVPVMDPRVKGNRRIYVDLQPPARAGRLPLSFRARRQIRTQ